MFKKLAEWLVPLFFVKHELEHVTNPGLMLAIQRVKHSPSLEKAMERALYILSDKYQSKRFETYVFFKKLYETDPNKLWERSGFMHCTQQNYLWQTLLVKSGWLKDDQIELGFSLVWYISPHQFLKVNLPTGQIAIDPWNYYHGVPMGQYASGFGSKSL